MDAQPLIVATELGLRVDAVRDVNDLLSHGFGTRGVIVAEGDLGDAFFDLRTGLAGELFQKVVQYSVPLAIVIADPGRHGERFAELSHEHSRHPQVRIVATLDEAKAWLAPEAGGGPTEG